MKTFEILKNAEIAFPDLLKLQYDTFKKLNLDYIKLFEPSITRAYSLLQDAFVMKEIKYLKNAEKLINFKYAGKTATSLEEQDKIEEEFEREVSDLSKKFDKLCKHPLSKFMDTDLYLDDNNNIGFVIGLAIGGKNEKDVIKIKAPNAKLDFDLPDLDEKEYWPSDDANVELSIELTKSKKSKGFPEDLEVGGKLYLTMYFDEMIDMLVGTRDDKLKVDDVVSGFVMWSSKNDKLKQTKTSKVIDVSGSYNKHRKKLLFKIKKGIEFSNIKADIDYSSLEDLNISSLEKSALLKKINVRSGEYAYDKIDTFDHFVIHKMEKNFNKKQKQELRFEDFHDLKQKCETVIKEYEKNKIKEI
jgi:hypothetical protein